MEREDVEYAIRRYLEKDENRISEVILIVHDVVRQIERDKLG